MRATRMLLGLLTAAALTVGVPPSAQAQVASPAFTVALASEDVRIPALDGTYAIAARIVRPEGPGPFGAVILNHGAPVSAADRRLESPDMLAHTAAIFARHGYVVVMPVRRGFGATGGEFAEDAGSCRNPDYLRGEMAAASDVMAAYEYAQDLPYVDGSRMILAGQSAGGVASIFTAGMHNPDGLVAVLAFAAGRGGNPMRSPGVPCAVEPLAQVFDALGKRVRVPVLFHYAENDLFFNATTSRLWFERFSAGGARAEYILQPAFGKDGHYIFSDDAGVKFWLPAVERFLSKYGVPFDPMAPQPPKPMLAGH